MAQDLGRSSRFVLVLLPILLISSNAQEEPVLVLDTDGNPVQYGHDVYVISANSSLGGGFTFQAYHFYDYVVLSSGPLFPGTPVRFAKAAAVKEDDLYIDTTFFIYSSAADWNGWNIWTVDVSRWGSSYVYLNSNRVPSGEFIVEKSEDGTDTYVLRVCPSSDFCHFIGTRLSGKERWACSSSSDEAIKVIFQAADGVTSDIFNREF
eukprot:c22343_g1_i1 orf=566-1186(-)